MQENWRATRVDCIWMETQCLDLRQIRRRLILAMYPIKIPPRSWLSQFFTRRLISPRLPMTRLYIRPDLLHPAIVISCFLIPVSAHPRSMSILSTINRLFRLPWSYHAAILYLFSDTYSSSLCATKRHWEGGGNEARIGSIFRRSREPFAGKIGKSEESRNKRGKIGLFRETRCYPRGVGLAGGANRNSDFENPAILLLGYEIIPGERFLSDFDSG